MKRLLFTSIFTLIAVPLSAQWQGTFHTNQVYAFGVHDSSLFASANIPNDEHLFRLDSTKNWYVGDTNWEHWTEADAGINFSVPNNAITSFAMQGQYFYAGIGGNDSYRSSDNGNHWKLIGNGPICSNGSYLFCDGIYRSSDNGDHWDSVAALNVNTFGTVGPIVLASATGGLWRTSDNGMSWKLISYPLAPPNTFAVIDTVIFGGTGPFIDLQTKGIARSTDSGASWQSIGFQHPVVALTTDGEHLFAGTLDSGVYVSLDMGEHWRQVNEGLPCPAVSALIVFDTFLFINSNDGFSSGRNYTGSRPISEMTSPPDAVAELQPSDTLSIYPNPATGVVTIFSGSTSIFGVRVLNVLGEEVIDLPNLREHEMMLDLSKLPSGTYFARIVTAYGEVQTVKLIKE